MSNLQAAIRVADQLISRLFDQRQFTAGEINYLTRELGSQIDPETNLKTAIKVNEESCVLADKYDNLCKNNDQLTSDLRSTVNNLKEVVERILTLESEQKEKDDQTLSAMREERERAKQARLEEMNMKLEEVTRKLKEEEDRLEEKYRKFEEKLRNERL